METKLGKEQVYACRHGKQHRVRMGYLLHMLHVYMAIMSLACILHTCTLISDVEPVDLRIRATARSAYWSTLLKAVCYLALRRHQQQEYLQGPGYRNLVAVLLGKAAERVSSRLLIELFELGLQLVANSGIPCSFACTESQAM